jgi:hypothetical protein
VTRISAFLEFVRREIDGTIQEDPSYRAYDLDRHTGYNALQRALRYIGYPGICGLMDLRSDLITAGYRGDVAGPLVRWWVWHRLTTGDLRSWPLRNKPQTDSPEQNEKASQRAGEGPRKRGRPPRCPNT